MKKAKPKKKLPIKRKGKKTSLKLNRLNKQQLQKLVVPASAVTKLNQSRERFNVAYYNKRRIETAKDHNQRHNRQGNEYAPYKRQTKTMTRTTKRAEKFVRVYAEGITSRPGKWLMREKDIIGLTPRQIQQKFALPHTPTHIIRVTVPKNRVLTMGVAAAKQNPTFGRKKGQGIQYEYRSVPRLRFSQGKPLPATGYQQ